MYCSVVTCTVLFHFGSKNAFVEGAEEEPPSCSRKPIKGYGDSFSVSEAPDFKHFLRGVQEHDCDCNPKMAVRTFKWELVKEIYLGPVV